MFASSFSIKSSSLLRLFMAIFGPVPIGFMFAFGIIYGPAAAEEAPVTFLLPIFMKDGLANAPPVLTFEMPKFGLLVTLEVPEPAIYGLIVGFDPVFISSPAPSIFYISLAIKSSTLPRPNLFILMVSCRFSNIDDFKYTKFILTLVVFLI